MSIQIKKAERKTAHLLISAFGRSGSGKTLSSLLLARGLVGPQGKIGVIDTESGRASLYESEVPGGFDVIELQPPFTPERYIEAIRAFEAARYPVIVIDTASHEWSGTGGVCEMAEATGKNGLQKWLRPKTAHKRFMNALTQTKAHVIFSLRAQERFKQVRNPSTNKEEIVSEGFYPVQDKNFIYEMTVSLPLLGGGVPDINPQTSKIPLFLKGAFPEGTPIGVGTGERLIQLLGPQADVDWDADDLRRSGNDAAEQGMDSLKKWWGSLSSKDKVKGKNVLETILKPIAEEADRIAADVRQSEEETSALADPFAAAA